MTVIASFRVSNTAVKQIEFAPRRKDIFLVSTADRVIRVYETEEVLCCGKNGEPEPIQKLQDLVNKTMWKKCCFSGGPDADYICAGSARQHALYIWERNVGNLVKILHGTKGELLLDVVVSHKFLDLFIINKKSSDSLINQLIYYRLLSGIQFVP